ncbi:MAG: HD domain-containing protein [Bryobacterales bacterium]|nr:HD domain-containing protein [Bryobacterales bacterium]
MIFYAIQFAAAAHSGQYRKGSRVPYIVHPIGVARTLLEIGCAEHVAVAGVLHDVVEDTHIKLVEVRVRFGRQVADLVEAASEPDRSLRWEDRKQHTIEFLGQAPEESLLIGLCDKLDNLRSIRQDLTLSGDEVWDRFRRPRESQQWYYESLSAVFARRVTSDPALRLVKDFQRELALVFPPPESGQDPAR